MPSSDTLPTNLRNEIKFAWLVFSEFSVIASDQCFLIAYKSSILEFYLESAWDSLIYI